MKQEIELLAPAGSYESMVAAINAGADAVYIGGYKFGARAYAENLDEDTLIKAIKYVHLHGKNIYLTINTLFKEHEIEELYNYIAPLYEAGLDAVIVQDFGVLRYIKRTFPKLMIHASTQMTVTGIYGAKLLKEYGVCRIVPARELSIDEIRSIDKECDIEIEVFVHGALCFCYSGQCLMSSMIGGRSGNRGRCAQPCRLPYRAFKGANRLNSDNETYVMSLKDLCGLDYLPELSDAGVNSLKIEGRMKSARYTAGVVSIYRKYLDMYKNKGKQGFKVDPKDKKLLLDLFDRGGFTDGYYTNKTDRNMLALHEKPKFRTGNNELFEYIDNNYINIDRKIGIYGYISIKKDESIKLTLILGEYITEVETKEPQLAQNRPISKEQVENAVSKIGNTDFEFEELYVDIDDGLFVPVQILKELRRKAIDNLYKIINDSYVRDLPERNELAKREDKFSEAPTLSVFVENMEQLNAVIENNMVSRIELESAGFIPDVWTDIVRDIKAINKEVYLSMPHIFRKPTLEYFENKIDILKKADFNGFIIHNLEELNFLREHIPNANIISDYNMYSWNSESLAFLEEFNVQENVIPLELNYKEIKAREVAYSEMLVYGQIPVMFTAQCFKNNVDVCNKSEDMLVIKDRKNMSFPIKSICKYGYTIIYNSVVMSLIKDVEKIKKELSPKAFRLQFTFENADKVKQILKSFEAAYNGNYLKSVLEENITSGHFKRGVE
jgi:Collagenase and related proteases